MKRILLVMLVVIGLVFMSLPVQADLNNGLVAYYPFNGNANDESGNANHGDVIGATLTQDRAGNASSAYHFDGSDDYIKVLSDDTLKISNDITITAWINFSGGKIWNPRVLSYYWGAGLGYDLFTLGLGDSRSIEFGHMGKFIKSSSTLQADQYHLITAVSENGALSLYFNGKKVDTTNTVAGTNQTPIPLNIGRNSDNGLDDFGGVMDDIRIYDRALSTSEIQELYSEGGIEPTPLEISTIVQPTSGTVPFTTTFDCTVDSGTSPYIFYWDFGDGATSTIQNPSHTYSNPGSYIAEVTVTDSGGQTSISSVSIQVNPSVTQTDIVILTDISPNTTITSGSDIKVYGSSGTNGITLESGAKAALFHFPGNNTITIEADSSLFIVSRSGSTVTFEGTDGTVLKIPATATEQAIVFNDDSQTLIISAGNVMLGSQVIGINPVAFESSLIADQKTVFIDLNDSIVQPEKIISFSEDLIEGNSSSKAKVLKDGYTSVFAVDENDNVIGMSFSSASDSIEINVDSTLKAIVMSFPVKWVEYDQTVPEILSLIKDAPEYATLKSHITTVLNNDPENLLSTRHPEIWSSAYSIVKYIKNVTTPQILNSYSKLGGWFDGPAYVEKGNNSVVKIMNPRHVPYGISSMNLSTGEVDFFKRPYFSPWKDFLGFFTGDTEIDYDVGNGDHLICVSKKQFLSLNGVSQLIEAYKDIILVLDFIESLNTFSPSDQMTLSAQLKGIIAWQIELLIQALNFVPVGGDFAALGVDILVQFANIQEIDVTGLVAHGGIDASKKIIDELDNLIAHGYDAKSVARSVCKKITGSADNGTLKPFLTKVKIGKKILANVLLVPEIVQDFSFLYDTVNAQDEAIYNVSIDSSGNQTIQDYDPPIVEITLPGTNSVAISSGAAIAFAGNASKDGKKSPQKT